MVEDEKQDLNDILVEETTRGKKHPKKAFIVGPTAYDPAGWPLAR